MALHSDSNLRKDVTSYAGFLHPSVDSVVSGVSQCVCTVLVAKKDKEACLQP